MTAADWTLLDPTAMVRHPFSQIAYVDEVPNAIDAVWNAMAAGSERQV
ncbi:hypothetical protein N5I87_03650 [Ralstonia sp. CHL-2022]|uniref:Uncharacterized protein n=1 Tax=Ralstonia mojiangensis TaxID=2953895 RepID=A0AAE3I0G4_9RALS|nr:hypothetical protein [Ralstonia mojiangensis]MCT7315085.1 hypothetical protein [Ralstonia mojiangensis]